MDDISLCIEKAVKRGYHKAAILLAIRHGWSAIAPLLATGHEDRLTAREKAEIVSAFADDSPRVAFELCYRWRVSRRIPQSIRDMFDKPRKEPRNETRTESLRQDQHAQHAQPFRRTG